VSFSHPSDVAVNYILSVVPCFGLQEDEVTKWF